MAMNLFAGIVVVSRRGEFFRCHSPAPARLALGLGPSPYTYLPSRRNRGDGGDSGDPGPIGRSNPRRNLSAVVTTQGRRIIKSPRIAL